MRSDPRARLRRLARRYGRLKLERAFARVIKQEFCHVPQEEPGSDAKLKRPVNRPSG